MRLETMSGPIFGPPELLFAVFVAVLILGTAGLLSYRRARRERAVDKSADAGVTLRGDRRRSR